MCCPVTTELSKLKFHLCANDLLGIVADGDIVTTQWMDSVGFLVPTVNDSDGTGDCTFIADATGNGHSGVQFDGVDGSGLKWPYSLSSSVTHGTFFFVVTGVADPGTARCMLTSTNRGTKWNKYYWQDEREDLVPATWQNGASRGEAEIDGHNVAGKVEIIAVEQAGLLLNWFYSDVPNGALGGTSSDYAPSGNQQEQDAQLVSGYDDAIEFIVGGSELSSERFNGIIHAVLFFEGNISPTNIGQICAELDNCYVLPGPGVPGEAEKRDAAGFERLPVLQLPYPSDEYLRDNEANLRRILEGAINDGNLALSRLDAASKSGLVRHADEHGPTDTDPITSLGSLAIHNDVTLTTVEVGNYLRRVGAQWVNVENAQILQDLMVATTVITTSHTAAPAARTILVDDDTAAADVTVTLPAAAVVDVYHIKKLGTTANVIIDANASETIDGGLTATLVLQYESVTLVSDGSNWHVI